MQYAEGEKMRYSGRGTGEPIIKKGNFDSSKWKVYQKKHLTKAVRMNKPFIVQTDEGELYCKNGYLAEDSRGFPYPIDKKEFEFIYEVKT